jgi:ATP-binding cassette subfamily F protein 3
VAKFYEGKPLISDVNISIHRGDRVGIVGPNGAGKSTILGMMEGAISADAGEISVEKRIRMGVLHQELVKGDDGPILEEVMNVSDELRVIRERLKELEEEMTTLTNADDETVERALEEHGRLQYDFERYDGYSLESRALKVLKGLGFQEKDARRKWSEFSGGWRMRVALAKILLAEPDALLLDEPTNHLDLDSLLWVEDFLAGYKGALVIVSHDRVFLNKLARKIVEIDRGKATVYSGNYDEYEKNKAMQEDVLRAAYKNQEEKKKRIQKFIDQNRVKARTASRAQSRIKMLEKLDRIEPPKSAKTISFNFRKAPPSGRRTVEISNVSKSYGDITVYENLSLFVERGDRIGLVGPNGAGKSTLMKMMAGVVPHDSGDIKYGHMVKPGYFAQHQAENLSNERSVLDEAASAADDLTEQEVRNLLGAFMFSGDDVFKKVKVLSGGEKSRLALAKILLSPPNLLLMDEPTNHLDIPSCQMLEQALNSYDGTLILITHDRHLMNRICTGILEISRAGAEMFIGTYDDYRYKKALLESEAEVSEEAAYVQSQPDKSEPESRESKKERRRKEAQSRAELSKKKGPLIKQITGLEKSIAEKESRRKEIQEVLAKPESYENRELIVPLLEEEPTLAKEIRSLEAQWEELQASLEELETAAGVTASG